MSASKVRGGEAAILELEYSLLYNVKVTRLAVVPFHRPQDPSKCELQTGSYAHKSFYAQLSIRSRLIVKNLPSYMTDARLREHFSSYSSTSGRSGTITDLKLMHRQGDGASRRFAFIGYKTEDDARAAKAYFDRTFIDSSRISVIVVDPVCFLVRAVNDNASFIKLKF